MVTGATEIANDLTVRATWQEKVSTHGCEIFVRVASILQLKFPFLG